MSTITVIIPTLDRPEKLARAITSVLDQKYPNLDIIVVDDGSTENIAAVVSRFSDQGVRLLRHDSSKGACAARNTGWRATDSMFIAFLDSDDVWLPDKLNRQMAIFDAAGPNLGMVYTSFSIIGDDIPILECDPDENDFARLAVSNMIGTLSTVVVRRNLLEEVGGLDEKLQSCQDWDLWMRLSQITQITGIGEVLVSVDVEGKRISSNRQASILGHRMFAAKHQDAVATLPRMPRAQHHLGMARIFFFNRSARDTLFHIWRALRSNPLALFKILGFVLARITNRLFKTLEFKKKNATNPSKAEL
ncbi:MAG: glycosyltransferase family A protein [Proteobacteria bacterium]|nr:glycosyltransferase family A protein [Pseudomonadota bacterium]